MISDTHISGTRITGTPISDTPMRTFFNRFRPAGASLFSAGSTLRYSLPAILFALICTAFFILLAGKNPLTAYWVLLRGAFGSADAIAFGLNKSAPYILAGTGVTLCFRARIINIGGEGQIAVGGICSAWAALHGAQLPAPLLVATALAAGAAGGALWALIAAVLRLTRGVNEVLSTLMLNFVGLLLVGAVLNGSMGEVGAGFPQSPLIPDGAFLPIIWPDTELHAGILLAIVLSAASSILLWRTPFGFRLRLIGASPPAARYAGISLARNVLLVMALAGALAGLAGGVEILGVQYRLIEGFSVGFGFNAVAVALLSGLEPLAVVPAGLFFGFVEAGALAMQREIGVPSSLVYVIQGLVMIFVLCAMGLDKRARRV
ncbi:MAG: hypothetical protein JWQ10_2516 [Herbaspirillum sp.]|nr:hypothetical protein [Herbaspirillum sp.]